MKKILSLLAICVMAVTSAWAEDPDYLCFTAEEATDVAFTTKSKSSWTPAATLQCSTDNKQTWKDYDFSSSATSDHTISLAVGEKVYFKAGKQTAQSQQTAHLVRTIIITSDSPLPAR